MKYAEWVLYQIWLLVDLTGWAKQPACWPNWQELDLTHLSNQLPEVIAFLRSIKTPKMQYARLRVGITREASGELPDPESPPRNRPGTPGQDPLPPDTHLYFFERHGEQRGRVRYRIRFLDEADIVPGFMGVRMIEYLLKQPGTRASAQQISRVFADEPSCGSLVAFDEVELTETSPEGNAVAGFTREDNRTEEPAGDNEIALAKSELSKHQEWLQEAAELGDTKREADLESKVRKLQDYLNREEGLRKKAKKSLPANDSPLEKARKRWVNNLENAYDKLRDAGLVKLVEHLSTHIETDNGGWVYKPDPQICWQFNAS